MMEKFGGKAFEAFFLVWTKMVGSNINFTFTLEIISTSWISLTFDINPLMIKRLLSKAMYELCLLVDHKFCLHCYDSFELETPSTVCLRVGIAYCFDISSFCLDIE